MGGDSLIGVPGESPNASSNASSQLSLFGSDS